MWINAITGQTFELHSDIRASLPDTSLPGVLTDTVLATVNVFPVLPVTPAHNPITHAATPIAPKLVGVQWIQQWEIAELPEGQVAINQAQANAKVREQAKAVRAAAVAAIRITTAAGHTFDGDEVSQGRMARAIIALHATDSPFVTWVLADNTVLQASAAELTEALALAGAAQAALWVL